MKAQFKVGNNLQIEVDVPDQKTLFQEMARHQEIFNHTKCGACKSTDLRFVVRHVVSGKKSYDYHEIHCQNPSCRARLAFGVNLEGGTLFPKRKGEDGKYLENNGWTKYVKDDNESKD